MSNPSNPADRHHFDYSPWSFWARADDQLKQAQRDLQTATARWHADNGTEFTLADHCFISELAAVGTDVLHLGERSYLAAHTYITGEIRMGRDCTVNPYTVVRGKVTMGDAVRVGAHTSIIGFNHTMSDPDVEVFRQKSTTKGITIGDDVWVGSHVTILDGVRVGSRSVLAAGAVVTKDVPDGAIVGGSPATIIRWRVPPTGMVTAARPHDLAGRLAAFADRARSQAEEVLDRAWDPTGEGRFVDKPGDPVTVRAQGDAIEVADLLLGKAPPQIPAEEQIRRLQALQDPEHGMVAAFDEEGAQLPAVTDLFDHSANYHVLSTGYALDLLGSQFPAPIRLVADADAATVMSHLDGLSWHPRPWSAGAWVDMLGTALRWNFARDVRGVAGMPEALFGRLVAITDPGTGMWGSGPATDPHLQMVNGFYRGSRGTFAQFGVPVPRPEAVVNTVLTHVQNQDHFAPDRQNACNVLDVAHPLWLAGCQTDHRRTEVEQLARRLLNDALSRWVDGAGMSFAAPRADAPNLVTTQPGLQGTEMWLAIIWLLADLIGLSSELGYRPRGVHRPEPAMSLV